MAFDPSAPPRKQINDDDGRPHDYRIVPFGASEGWRLAVALFALVGGSLGKLLSGLLGSGKGADLGKLLDADLDLGAIVRDLAEALMSAEGNGEQLLKRLLRNVTRDGKSLENVAVFDQAYQANYGELAEVIVWAVEVNGFARFFGRLLTQAGTASPSRFPSTPGSFSPGSPMKTS